MKSSRFGPQPVREALVAERWTVPAAARRIGVPANHLKSAVHGRTAPSPVLREQLPALLGVPLAQLFTAEALATEFNPRVGPGSRARQADPRYTGVRR